MTLIQSLQLSAGGAMASIIYMAPTLVAVARLRSDLSRIVLFNTFLGWTVLGWIWALHLACRRSEPVARSGAAWTPWQAGRPEAPRPPVAAPATYVDGSYLISANESARTWAICSAGRWGIAFELDGVQRTAAWVDTTDVPIEVLADALTGHGERYR